MFKDVANFFVIWVLVVFSFTIAGVVGFQEVEELKTIENGTFYWLEATMGSYDIEVFDVLLEAEPPKPNLRQVAIYLVVLYVIMNLIVLINVVIAMMADTYVLMTSVKKGVYNYNIVKTSNAYNMDAEYGALLLFSPPFSFISTLLIPFYNCMKKKDERQTFTRTVQQIWYCFFITPLVIVFFAFNLILVPFAYLKTAVHKVTCLSVGRTTPTDVLVYAVFGLFINLLALIPDTVNFVR